MSIKEAFQAKPKIPKIIHQTWKTCIEGRMPGWSRHGSWIHQNPGYEYRCWDDDQAKELIGKARPEMAPYLDALPIVEISDIFRYAVIEVYGGYYFDMDVSCVKPLDHWPWLAEGETAYAGLEGVCSDEENRLLHRFAVMSQYAQWALAAKPGHPVMRDVLDRIQGNLERSENTEKGDDNYLSTIFKTGPGPWSEAVEAQSEHIKLLDENAFNYDGLTETHPERVQEDRLVYHWFKGTWKDGYKDGEEGGEWF